MNKKIITITIFILLGIIIVPTIYKVYKIHHEKLFLVVKLEFEYQANKCFKEGKCPNDKVYLKELYKEKYLDEKLIDPITKQYYSDDSTFIVSKKEIDLKY